MRFSFTPEHIEFLKANYATMLSEDIANEFGCSIHSIRGYAFRLGLKKDPEFLKEHFRKKMLDPNHPARAHQIKKGNVPPNKGKKQSEYMSPETIERTKGTRFQKGHRPGNTKYDGAISERPDKNGHTYKYIRVALGKWVPLHRYLWKEKHGEIPPGHNIQFKDGNSLNCHIDNLYMISRSDQLKNENSFYANFPEEMHRVFHLKAVLKKQINKQEKNEIN